MNWLSKWVRNPFFADVKEIEKKIRDEVESEYNKMLEEMYQECYEILMEERAKVDALYQKYLEEIDLSQGQEVETSPNSIEIIEE